MIKRGVGGAKLTEVISARHVAGRKARSTVKAKAPSLIGGACLRNKLERSELSTAAVFPGMAQRSVWREVPDTLRILLVPHTAQ